ncbi:Glyoxalase family protein [Alkalibacterium sp. AK22]|uniref:VOC family protein n=1 Tax=Alkalibacterium sp. AK22 TaxID=1229520 RepID=UPI000452AC56|nr:VOC family protein [Alkalibacterium sp. AK22]EXJ23194.1 Glyoxalase family protein [Alkalibacterium sp. AK22]
MFAIDSNLNCSRVELNVRNLSKLADFYTKVIGMKCLSQDEHTVSLGVGGNKQTLVKLTQVQKDNHPKGQAGLYHFALRLPNRSELGSVLYSLLIQ